MHDIVAPILYRNVCVSDISSLLYGLPSPPPAASPESSSNRSGNQSRRTITSKMEMLGMIRYLHIVDLEPLVSSLDFPPPEAAHDHPSTKGTETEIQAAPTPLSPYLTGNWDAYNILSSYFEAGFDHPDRKLFSSVTSITVGPLPSPSLPNDQSTSNAVGWPNTYGRNREGERTHTSAIGPLFIALSSATHICSWDQQGATDRQDKLSSSGHDPRLTITPGRGREISHICHIRPHSELPIILGVTNRIYFPLHTPGKKTIRALDGVSASNRAQLVRETGASVVTMAIKRTVPYAAFVNMHGSGQISGVGSGSTRCRIAEETRAATKLYLYGVGKMFHWKDASTNRPKKGERITADTTELSAEIQSQLRMELSGGTLGRQWPVYPENIHILPSIEMPTCPVCEI